MRKLTILQKRQSVWLATRLLIAVIGVVLYEAWTSPYVFAQNQPAGPGEPFRKAIGEIVDQLNKGYQAHKIDAFEKNLDDQYFYTYNLKSVTAVNGAADAIKALNNAQPDQKRYVERFEGENTVLYTPDICLVMMNVYSKPAGAVKANRHKVLKWFVKDPAEFRLAYEYRAPPPVFEPELKDGGTSVHALIGKVQPAALTAENANSLRTALLESAKKQEKLFLANDAKAGLEAVSMSNAYYFEPDQILSVQYGKKNGLAEIRREWDAFELKAPPELANMNIRLYPNETAPLLAVATYDYTFSVPGQVQKERLQFTMVLVRRATEWKLVFFNEVYK